MSNRRKNRIIQVVLVLLVAATVIGIMVNRQQALVNAALLDTAEIALSVEGKESARINMENLNNLPAQDFKAMLKSSVMVVPIEHTYTGISLKTLFSSVGVSLKDRKQIMVHSVDGYAVPLTISEVTAIDNVYLVYKDNGKYLGTYKQTGGQGPYMIVVKGDQFSQRWAKYVCKLDLQ